MEQLKKAQEALNKLTCICISLNQCVAELVKIESRPADSSIDETLNKVLTMMEISVQSRKVDLLLDELSSSLEELAENLTEYLNAKRTD